MLLIISIGIYNIYIYYIHHNKCSFFVLCGGTISVIVVVVVDRHARHGSGNSSQHIIVAVSCYVSDQSYQYQ